MRPLAVSIVTGFANRFIKNSHLSFLVSSLLGQRIGPGAAQVSTTIRALASLEQNFQVGKRGEPLGRHAESCRGPLRRESARAGIRPGVGFNRNAAQWAGTRNRTSPVVAGHSAPDMPAAMAAASPRWNRPAYGGRSPWVVGAAARSYRFSHASDFGRLLPPAQISPASERATSWQSFARQRIPARHPGSRSQRIQRLRKELVTLTDTVSAATGFFASRALRP